VPRRVLAYLLALPDHPLLDRVVRGRTWIALLGVMLVGIVAMQVELLKLGRSIGRSLGETTALQSRNEQLRVSVAALADESRVDRLAVAGGMVLPSPTGVGFVSPETSVARALANIHAPDAALFAAASGRNGAVTTTVNDEAGQTAGAGATSRP
jgi:cell division protein FtsL